MATYRKKEASIVSIAMFLALAAVTPKLLVASFIPNPVLAQQSTPVSFPMPTSVPSGTTVRIDGSSSMEKANQALKQRFEKQYAGTKVEVNAQGSDAALKELLDGQIDLAAIGRPLTEQEKAQGLVQVPLSRQKIAIIVGPDNPYKGDITFDKFAGIFRGQITNWSQIGGPPVPIVLIDRPESSDTRRAFKSYQVFQTAPFKTGANAKPISQDSTIEVIKQLGKNGIGYAIADQVMDRQDVHIIRMHKVLPDSPKYPFSQTLSYVYKQSNPNPGIPLYLGFATASSNQQIVKEAIANTTTAPAAPQPAPSQPAQTAKPTDPGMSSTLIKGGGETGTSEAGFPWWLVLLLGIPLLGGLLWWLLKSGRPQAGSPVDAIPPTDKPSTLPPTVVAPVPPPPSSRLFLVPYDGKNAYAYWEIVPAQLEAVQRGGGELMLRLYDVTGISRSERYSPYILQQFGCDAEKQYLLLTLPAENRDYMVELGYLTEAGGWVPLTRSETVRIAANIPTGNVIVLDSSRGNWQAGAIAHVATAPSHSRLFLVPYDGKNAYAYWEINPAQVEALQHGGGEKLMLRLYDITGPDSEGHSPYILQQFGCEFQQQYLLLTLPAENRDYIAELGYLTKTGGWLLLARSATVRVAASVPTDNVFMLEGSRGNGHAALLAQAASPSHSRLFLVPYDGKNTYAYWEIAPAQIEALQRGGGQKLMLRLYDVTDIPNPEHHTLRYLHEYDCDPENQYLVITLPEENRDYIVELGYLTQAENWVLLARSGTVRVTANASTGNVALFLVLRDSNNAYTYWEIPPSAISALKHPIVT